MFKKAADKFWNKFELGKVYYVSKGTLQVENKQIQNSSKWLQDDIACKFRSYRRCSGSFFLIGPIVIRKCWKGACHYEENRIGLFYIFPLMIELAREVLGEDNEWFWKSWKRGLIGKSDMMLSLSFMQWWNYMNVIELWWWRQFFGFTEMGLRCQW